MNKIIKKAAILGSGIMGSGLASHLANAGIESLMLDIVPKALTAEEEEKGVTTADPVFRNRIVNGNKKAFIEKMRPPGLMDKSFAVRIQTGNLEDDLDKLADCDWIVEVVAENLDIKRSVLKTIEPHIRPDAIITSNTSGISINSIAAEMPESFRERWMGVHFFNPVRYMELVELIPGNDTLPEVLRTMHRFCEKILGKTPVVCKDTPCFIANRIGAALGTDIMRLMEEAGMTFSEVDAITGQCLGRPKTASFMLYDMVGLDIGVASAETITSAVTDPWELNLLRFPEYVKQMLADKRLGNKTGQGFYKKDGKDRLMFDPKTQGYIPQKPADFPSLKKAQAEKALPRKLKALFDGDDAASKLAWTHMKHYFIHAASLIPEIADELLDMDQAMVLGYNHQAGPFAVWNGLDLPSYISRMEREGNPVPTWVHAMLDAGVTAFYTEKQGRTYVYSIRRKAYVPVEAPSGAIRLKNTAADGKLVRRLGDSALYDIGDGVLCLEIQSLNAALTEALLDDMLEAGDEMERNWQGMVMTNSGKNFCVGADLKGALAVIKEGRFSELEQSVYKTQMLTLKNKYASKPIVCAPHGMALGGGCELLMQCAAVQAHGETYMGLVELGVGLIPGGGGLKELTLRALERPGSTTAFVTDFLLSAVQVVATAKTSASAFEAVGLGFMQASDGVSLSIDYLIADAKNKVLALASSNYTPPEKKAYRCAAINDNALLSMVGRTMRDGGYMTEYDLHIFDQVVYVMTGGGLSKNELITEEYLLQLEREAFIGLCREKKTQERIEHMLTTGKPLRN